MTPLDWMSTFIGYERSWKCPQWPHILGTWNVSEPLLLVFLGPANMAPSFRQGWRLPRGAWLRCSAAASVPRLTPRALGRFGLPAKPQPKLENIKDDPVKVSNKRGTIVPSPRSAFF